MNSTQLVPGAEDSIMLLQLPAAEFGNTHAEIVYIVGQQTDNSHK